MNGEVSNDLKNAHPRVVWLFFIRHLFALSIVPVGITLYMIARIPAYANAESSGEVLVASVTINVAIIFWFLMSFLWARLSYRYYRYGMSEHGFERMFGVVWKRQTIIPYEVIQHVDIEQGILHGLFGLVELHIETFGKMHHGQGEYLPGLTRETAEQLEKELISRHERGGGSTERKIHTRES